MIKVDLIQAFNSYCKVPNRLGRVFYQFLIFKNLLHVLLDEQNNGKLSVISVSLRLALALSHQKQKCFITKLAAMT